MQGAVGRGRSSHTFGLLVGVLTAALVGPVGSAVAGTVDASEQAAGFEAAPGETNRVTVTATPTSIVFSDINPITSSSCQGSGTGTVTCTPVVEAGSTPGFFSSYGVFTGDGDDSITAAGPLAAGFGGSTFRGILGGSGLDGGSGNDTIVGSNENVSTPSAPTGPGTTGGIEQLDGGPGTDIVLGRGGDDTGSGGRETDDGVADDNGDKVDLGAGNDSADISSSDGTGDTYQGGPGIDSLSVFGGSSPDGITFPTYSVNLTTGAFLRSNYLPQSDATPGFEDFSSSAIAGNTVVGNSSSNVIDTDDGRDLVNPSAGADQLYLRGGADIADTRDGFADRVQCGPGADSVAADQFDELTDCETVAVTKARPAGADVAAPACKLTKLKSRYTSRSFARGIAFRFACSEQATLTVQEYVTFKGSKSLATASRAGDLVLAEKTIKLGALKQRIKLKPSRRLARRLPRRFTVKFRVTARDEFGNRSVVTKKSKVSNRKAKKRKAKKRKGN